MLRQIIRAIAEALALPLMFAAVIGFFHALSLLL